MSPDDAVGVSVAGSDRRRRSRPDRRDPVTVFNPYGYLQEIEVELRCALGGPAA